MKEMGYSTYTKLYESLVAPVMDYGSAVWGNKAYDNLEQVQCRAMRFFTGVHRLCPVGGYVGDMGWASNRTRWKLEALRLWNRLVKLDSNRLVKKVFEWDIECHRGDNKSNFAAKIKQILCEIKMKPMYNRLSHIDIVQARKILLEKDSDEWKRSLGSYKAKLDVYNTIKTDFGVERYLQLNIDKYEKSLLSQVRYGILPLRVETGRFKNEPRQERLCIFCDANAIENVEHFLFECSLYDMYRLSLVEKAKRVINNWENLTDLKSLSKLFEVAPRTLGRYVKEIFLYRRSKIYK